VTIVSSHPSRILTNHEQVLATWNKREGELIAANKLDRIVAQPPNATNVHAGSASEEIKAKVGKEGARTIPGMSLIPKILASCS
jgi:formamidase